MTKLIVVYDSCVLYSAPLRDLLMRLALADLVHAKWTKDIHKEWIDNLLKNRPDLTRSQLVKVQQLMDLHARDCLVTDYEPLINKLALPDPNDRHVLAAAIKAKAHIIVTFNISDFPEKALKQYNIQALHPDHFLELLFNMTQSEFLRIVQQTRLSLKNPPKNPREYLLILKQQSLHKTVLFLQKNVALI